MGSNAVGNPLLKQVTQGATMGGGFVYVAAFDLRGPVKIGKSVKPRIRLAGIETASGQRFRHVFVTEECLNFNEAELSLHKQLDSIRTIGEWFNIEFPAAVVAVKAADLTLATTPHITMEELRKAANKVKPPSEELEQQYLDAGIIKRGKDWGFVIA